MKLSKKINYGLFEKIHFCRQFLFEAASSLPLSILVSLFQNWTVLQEERDALREELEKLFKDKSQAKVFVVVVLNVFEADISIF